MENQQLLGTERISKLLLKYSIPAIIGMLVNSLYNVVDRIFIGNIPGVGPLAITGLGVTMPIMTIILAFGMLIGIGTTTTISIKLGQGKVEEARKLIGNAMTLSVITGIIIMILGILFANKILTLFGASENTLIYAKSYINIILLGTVVNLLSFSLNHSIRADGSPKISAGIMIVGCLTNIVLDWILIFGFNLGIQGAAIATVTSQALTAVLTIGYYISGKSNLRFSKSNLKLDTKLIKAVFAIGMSPFAMQLAASLVQVISNIALKTHGGDLAIGAMATISSIAMVFLMPIFGINQGAQPIIGFNYGAEKYDRVKKAYLGSLAVATIILCMGMVVIMLFPEAIIGIFNKDPELMNISVNGLRIYLLMLPIVGLSVTGTNFIQSIGKAKMAMLLSLLRQVILLIPAVLILPTFLGLQGVWTAQPVSDFIATVITGIVVFRELKRYTPKTEKLNENERLNEITTE
ncbi:MATE family efflux transporter [Clostridioides difficile]|uniref:Multidrug export protein MepA n=3 Tax=Clostridioides difficile TaxID=1496 RepID=A0AAX3GX75_CLODI|nr:MATE family efflux transporter [Clostridioides difficile]AVD35283.1 MATE family efflux transporter [Clostridioides difficile]AVD37854.1 MATE family efflux transporter [Clostridioides difficile]AVD41392.1 MATE family efflux transporter [Clostridioides difficile]AXU67880.1 drug/sodium antiporter [Clostridioides difficile]AXU90066.1 drug/sodium antiporter [Clostridioides difficile]